MSDGTRHDALIDDLVGGLTPSGRLASPGRRALGWTALVAAAALVLTPWIDWHSLAERMGVSDLRLAAIGSAITAVTAGLAAFQTSVPGRSSRWALLPLPSAALWIGASGVGCLRSWTIPVAEPTTPNAMEGCFAFILAFSLPLSIVLVAMLRRACPLRPNLTAALAGLAAAAAAATLLVLFHPHDATAEDLLIHLVVVAAVVAANGLLGGRLLDGRGT